MENVMPRVKMITKSEFMIYKQQLMELFKENYFKNRRNAIFR